MLDRDAPPGFEAAFLAAAGLESNVVFLDAERQRRLAEAIPAVGLLPWGHPGRKNAGCAQLLSKLEPGKPDCFVLRGPRYLFAALSGARAVWDFDDGSELRNTSAADHFVAFAGGRGDFLDVLEVAEPCGQLPSRVEPTAVL